MPAPTPGRHDPIALGDEPPRLAVRYGTRTASTRSIIGRVYLAIRAAGRRGLTRPEVADSTGIALHAVCWAAKTLINARAITVAPCRRGRYTVLVAA